MIGNLISIRCLTAVNFDVFFDNSYATLLVNNLQFLKVPIINKFCVLKAKKLPREVNIAASSGLKLWHE